jgi:glucoamylase
MESMLGKNLRRLLVLPWFLLTIVAATALSQEAPGGPGALPTWTPANKEGVGTSTAVNSRVWFTLQGGTLSEVYYPQLDSADVRRLEFAVSDGKRVWIESRDLEHSITRLRPDALLYQQSSRDPGGRFMVRKTYATDPARDTLLIDVTFTVSSSAAATPYSLYVLYTPSLRNSGYGDTGSSTEGILVASKQGMATALACTTGFSQTSNGFEGTSDAYSDLLLHKKLLWSYSRAENGNVIQAARISDPARFTLALGFGKGSAEATANAKASLGLGFPKIASEYSQGWADYARTLRRVSERYEDEFLLAAMVLKAHEDKTYRGAMIASMSIPWGFAVKADSADVGGYHLVWARDLYEIATGLLAAGDRDAALRALHYLFYVQQEPDGRFPQNSWLDGRPFLTAIQMDEVSYPMILAWQLGRTDKEIWEKHVRPEADFVVSHGPATEEERWEEVPGYSPSTIAAEIAGLVCAADIARQNGATDDAQRYMRTADDWASHIEDWLVTKTGHLGGPLASQGYYIRIDNDLNPNDGYELDVRNGGGVWDERDVVDAGFLELVRLGIRPANDPIIDRSLKIVDETIRVETPNGPAFHRYNHDGYGETYFGGPWLSQGIGRVWPVFAGERGEYEVALGHDATPYLEAMLQFANAGGMIPEQVWDRAGPTPAGFSFGSGTGSATPLAWSMAEFLRLAACAQEKRIVEQPSIVAAHFLKIRH